MIRITVDGAGGLRAGNEHPGRGTYAHRNASCLRAALRSVVLSRALRRQVREDEASRLGELLRMEMDNR